MKRIGLLLAMPLAAAGLFFGGCREAKKESCRELFYRHYEAQVKGFMRATPDANPLLSRKVAEYMLNRMFELSTLRLSAWREKRWRLFSANTVGFCKRSMTVWSPCMAIVAAASKNVMKRISRALCVRCPIRIRFLPGKEPHSP